MNEATTTATETMDVQSATQSGSGSVDNDKAGAEQAAESENITGQSGGQSVNQGKGQASNISDGQDNSISGNNNKPEPDGKEAGKNQADAAELWKNLGSHLPPDAGLDSGMLEDFKSYAQKTGLNPEVAENLIGWQYQAAKKYQERMREEGLRVLSDEWGQKTQANLNDALGVVTMLDRKLDGAFSQAIGKFGIGNDLAFVRGLYELSRLLGEDSIGSRHAPAPAQKEETALDGLKELFGKGK